jgi:ribonuclease T1
MVAVPRLRLLLAALAVVALAISGCSTTVVDAPTTNGAAPDIVVPTTPSDRATAVPPIVPRSGLPAIPVGDLPREALAVLDQVEAGGPYEYRQDGQTFQNRERILPAQPPGFYREFTVETPGSYDRGARRLVVGSDGVVFYTSDHYQSFREVIR